MANPGTIRTAIKTAISSVTGLECYDFRPEKPEPPFAIVMPDPNIFITRESMSASATFQFRYDIILAVSAVVDDQAQLHLDAYLDTSGTNSVWTALEADRTLGGTGDVSAVAVIQYGHMQIADFQFYGAQIQTNVFATK